MNEVTMRRFFYVSVILLACYGQPFVLASSITNEWRYAITSSFQGTNYTQMLSAHDLPQLHTWDPYLNPCPISVSNVLRITQGELEKKFPHNLNWSVQNILLQRLRKTNVWFYVIKYDLNPRESFSIIVTLDGSIPTIKEGTPEHILYNSLADSVSEKPPESGVKTLEDDDGK